MQPPAFWRDLGAEFQGLPDSVWANRDAPDRLQMSNGEVRGGDASLRARFKDVAARGGMALCAERGLGFDRLDALWIWEEAVMAYLKEEKNPWHTEFRSTRWKPSPTKIQELALSEIRPRRDAGHFTVEETCLLEELAERIQGEGIGRRERLSVMEDDQGYVVIDSESEDRQYWVCRWAGVTSVTCEIHSARNPGVMEDILDVGIDCVSVASADLCGRLATEAFGRQLAPPVERPATRPDGRAIPAPVVTPPTRRARVDAFLARCNREYPDRKFTKTDIWKLAHETRTQFQRWQRGAEETTGSDNITFDRILAKTPHEFLEDVTNRRTRPR